MDEFIETHHQNAINYQIACSETNRLGNLITNGRKKVWETEIYEQYFGGIPYYFLTEKEIYECCKYINHTVNIKGRKVLHVNVRNTVEMISYYHNRNNYRKAIIIILGLQKRYKKIILQKDVAKILWKYRFLPFLKNWFISVISFNDLFPNEC